MMKHPAFIITFAPVAISIACSVLFAINEFFPLLPVWLLWEIVMVSTMMVFFIAVLLLVAYAVQKAMHQTT